MLAPEIPGQRPIGKACTRAHRLAARGRAGPVASKSLAAASRLG
jgi:hypothetical protein